MSEPDKKDKPKKKKSVKEKENVEGLAPQEGERKSSITPERRGSEMEPKSRKASKADGVEKQASRKSSVAAEEGGEKKVPKSRKSSEAVESSKPESGKIQSTEEEEDEEPVDLASLLPPPPKEWDPNKTPFEAFAEADKIDVNAPVKYFDAPPETSKTDLHLLQDLDTRRLAELMEAFNMFDFDQDGVISGSDLRRTFASLDRPDISDEEIQQMLSEGLNPLDFDAFIVLMGYKTLELDAEEVLTNALSQWDYGVEGLISEERIRRDLIAFGEKFSEEEAYAALEDAPLVITKNKEKMINYIKFSNDLCGLRKRMKEYQKNQ